VDIAERLRAVGADIRRVEPVTRLEDAPAAQRRAERATASESPAAEQPAARGDVGVLAVQPTWA